MKTWALTVQKIEQESPLSIKLLQIMSYLVPDNLPSSFIEQPYQLRKKIISSSVRGPGLGVRREK